MFYTHQLKHDTSHFFTLFHTPKWVHPYTIIANKKRSKNQKENHPKEETIGSGERVTNHRRNNHRTTTTATITTTHHQKQPPPQQISFSLIRLGHHGRNSETRSFIFLTLRRSLVGEWGCMVVPTLGEHCATPRELCDSQDQLLQIRDLESL